MYGQTRLVGTRCIRLFNNIFSSHDNSAIEEGKWYFNLLHAEVSYIINIACHWTFFPILPLFGTPEPLFIPPAFMPRGIKFSSFCSSVCMFVRSFIRLFVRTSVQFVELLQSFTCKQLEWSISHQPLIRKHSYLDHRYPGGSAFIP